MEDEAIYGSEDQQTLEAPKGAGDEQQLIDAVEAETLFAADLEPVRLDWPKAPGCWVELTPMDGPMQSKFAALGITWSQKGGKLEREESARVQADERDIFLVEHTVTDFLLKRQKRATTGERIVEETRCTGQGKSRREFIRTQLCGQPHLGVPGLAPGHWRWLVYQCLKVNGLLETQQGN